MEWVSFSFRLFLRGPSSGQPLDIHVGVPYFQPKFSVFIAFISFARPQSHMFMEKTSVLFHGNRACIPVFLTVYLVYPVLDRVEQ